MSTQPLVTRGRRIRRAAEKTLGVSLTLAILGFWTSSVITAPGNAIVYVDVAYGTYLSPPCVPFSSEQKAEWQRQISDATTPEDTAHTFERLTGLRVSTITEARRKGFRADRDCNDRGGLSMEGRSLTGLAFERVGILRPLSSRWGENGSWNW
jgi:hypothetical protein